MEESDPIPYMQSAKEVWKAVDDTFCLFDCIRENRRCPPEIDGKAQYISSAAPKIDSLTITDSGKVILLVVQPWPAAR